MMPVNALATLLETFFTWPIHTYAHIDTKALLYPCCACACRV